MGVTRLPIIRRDLLLLSLAAASWGVGTVVSKRAVDEFPPFTLLTIQLAASLAILAILMRVSGLSLRGSPTLLGRLGILNPGVAYGLGLLGLTYISASMSVLLWALEPLLILLLAGIFLGEWITPRFVVLSLVAALGMSLVVFDPASSGQWPGVVLTLAGIVCCAAYTVIARRFVAAADSTAQVVLAQQAHALGFAIVVLAVVAVVGGPVGPQGLSPLGLTSAIVSGVLYYAAAYWLYLGALRTVPASYAATSFYLIPVFGVAAGVLLLGDQFDPVQWLGVAVVVAAVSSIVRLSTRREAHEPRPRPAVAQEST